MSKVAWRKSTVSLKSASDEELAERVLQKDREALGELFRRYHKRFYRLAFRFLGDAYLADDLTSEIFLRIYKYLKSFDPQAQFKPWAYKIATNTCLTYKSKRKESRIKTQEDEETGEPEAVDEKVDLIAETQKNETAERVQQALNKLPEKYRLVLYLYYFEDLKYEEIASSLELPLNTVRTHLKRGKEMLKKDLADLI